MTETKHTPGHPVIDGLFLKEPILPENPSPEELWEYIGAVERFKANALKLTLLIHQQQAEIDRLKLALQTEVENRVNGCLMPLPETPGKEAGQ